MGVYIAWPSWRDTFDHLFPDIKVLGDGSIPADAKLVVLPGGEDINPVFYGEKDGGSDYNTYRDIVELRMFAEAMQRGIPVFGVCRGHQLINVALGGSLIQHLPAEKIKHGGGHMIDWHDEKLNARINLDFVNSLHHQGYNAARCSPSLTPLATFDSVVEVAIGDKVFSTQFHPEMMDTKRINDLISFVYEWAHL